MTKTLTEILTDAGWTKPSSGVDNFRSDGDIEKSLLVALSNRGWKPPIPEWNQGGHLAVTDHVHSWNCTPNFLVHWTYNFVRQETGRHNTIKAVAHHHRGPLKFRWRNTPDNSAMHAQLGYLGDAGEFVVVTAMTVSG